MKTEIGKPTEIVVVVEEVRQRSGEEFLERIGEEEFLRRGFDDLEERLDLDDELREEPRELRSSLLRAIAKNLFLNRDECGWG